MVFLNFSEFFLNFPREISNFLKKKTIQKIRTFYQEDDENEDDVDQEDNDARDDNDAVPTEARLWVMVCIQIYVQLIAIWFCVRANATNCLARS